MFVHGVGLPRQAYPPALRGSKHKGKVESSECEGGNTKIREIFDGDVDAVF